MIELLASAIVSNASLRQQNLTIRYPFATLKPVSSPYNLKRFHPVIRRVRPHKGTDFAAPNGTPVQSVISGRVVFAGWMQGYGKVVVVQNDYQETLMAHLSSIWVAKDQNVVENVKIGAVGSTGWSTGPHLHIELRLKINNRWTYVDPQKYFDSAEIDALKS